MPNMRLVMDNAIDRATLSASTTAGALAAANLQAEFKSLVWRATGTSATLTAIWPSAEFIGMVSLPFCNLTAAATLRVKGYTGAADPSPAFDSGAILCNPSTPLGLWDWGASALGANSYSYGGGTYATVWFATQAFAKITVDIVDTANTLGYVEAARLVAGGWWAPAFNSSWGASASITDTSRHERNDSGDLMTVRGVKSRKLTLPMQDMSAADRAKIWSLLKLNGMSRPFFFSLFPEGTDTDKEQAHQIFGKLSSLSAISNANYASFSTSLEIEEV